jgi:dinuclear metal center YbgI/SA1388 family protein
VAAHLLPQLGAMNSPVDRNTLVSVLHTVLDADRFKDYGPNGLQVEGKTTVRKVVTGVTASLALIEAAVAAQADAVLVHHGLFWRGQDGRVVGWMKQRLQRLLAADVNLIAYHLPLDAHPTLGNNAQLAQRLGLITADAEPLRFGEQQLGWVAQTPQPTQLADFASHCAQALARTPVVVGDAARPIRRVGLCTGGAQSYFEAAIAAGVDVFITGEISEPQAHYARECGVAYLACGHHATERYGVQALGRWLSEQHGVEHAFIDIDNPA